MALTTTVAEVWPASVGVALKLLAFVSVMEAVAGMAADGALVEGRVVDVMWTKVGVGHKGRSLTYD